MFGLDDRNWSVFLTYLDQGVYDFDRRIGPNYQIDLDYIFLNVLFEIFVNFFYKISYEISVGSPMMRVLGLVFAFNLLLLTAACTFCCFPCCCF